MKRDDLVASASLLAQPSAAAAAEYAAQRDALAAELNRRMIERSDLVRLIGEGNGPMMEDNHRNHARFMAAVFAHYSPEVLVDTVLWVFRAYRSHGFRLAYWPAQLDSWVELLREKLSPGAFSEIYPFYDWLIVNQPAFALLTDPAAQQT